MKEYNEMSDFGRQIIDEVNDLNASIVEAKRKAYKLMQKLFEAAPMHESSATIQECAENIGWIGSCLDFEVNQHICDFLRLFGKVE